MTKKVKLVLHDDAIQELLKSPGIVADLNRRAEQIATQAGPEFEITNKIHKQRAVVNVEDKTEGSMFREAETGKLARAVEAAGMEIVTGKKRGRR